jgi:hypothetical protein
MTIACLQGMCRSRLTCLKKHYRYQTIIQDDRPLGFHSFVAGLARVGAKELDPHFRYGHGRVHGYMAVKWSCAWAQDGDMTLTILSNFISKDYSSCVPLQSPPPAV